MRRTDLPIFDVADSIAQACRDHGRLVVEAPTGSGKSTQVPQILLDRGLVPSGQIVILQPRRLPTRMLAARVARERGVELGGEVGFQFRLTNCSGRNTRIKYVTEGILLRQLLSDGKLSNIGAVICDEFHERHLEADAALALIMLLQKTTRPDLKLIVMSATLDSDALSRHLDPCAVVKADGRVYPVSVEYLAKPVDEAKTMPWDLAAAEFDRLAPGVDEGHALIFMPGVYEINRTVQAIQALKSARGMRVLPLHGQLREEDQDLAVAPSDFRKVVVSTNVAETSLTIDGVRLVIDSGLARVPRFDPRRGIDTLLVEKISRASADQRTGRAGRTAAGHCVRLWTEKQQHERPAQTEPEITRIDLSEMTLMLKAGLVTSQPIPADESGARIAEILSLPWLEPPPAMPLARAWRLLADLGAVEADTGRATAMGRKLALFPVHPRFGRMLCEADTRGCVPAAALICAITQERNLLFRRVGDDVKKNREWRFPDDSESDLLLLMHAWDLARQSGYDLDLCKRLGIHGITARKVERNFSQIFAIARGAGLNTQQDSGDSAAIRRSVLAGFSDQLACRLNAGTNRCRLVHQRSGTLAVESAVRKSNLFVACDITELERGRNKIDVTLSLCTGIEEEWLKEMFPGDFSERESAVYDATAKRVVLRRERTFRDLVIETVTGGNPSPDKAAVILAEEVRKGNLSLKNWDHEVEQWVARVNLVSDTCPESGVPLIDDEARQGMLEQVCHGAFGQKDIKDRPVLHVAKQWLSAEQNAAVDKLAPLRLELSNGKAPKITYESGKPPFIQARIQELFGLQGKLTVAKGRIALLVHVLAPSNRPVQVTADMTGFWRDHYPRIKQELQRKYPKHEWR